MKCVNEEEGGGENTPTSSVGNIQSYSKMLLKQSLKRKIHTDITPKDFEDLTTNNQDKVLKKYKSQTPCLFKFNNKYLMVSKND